MAEACEVVEPLLSAWLDGQLDEREGNRVTAHLAGCERCATALDELASLASMLRNLPVRRTPDDLVTARRSHGQPQAAVRRVQALAVATGLLVGAAFAMGAGEPQERAVPAPLDALVNVDHGGDALRGQVMTPIWAEIRP